MRLTSSWFAAGLATLTLLAACSPGDRSAAPTEPPTSFAVTAPPVILEESFEDNSFSGRGWYDNVGMATTPAQHTAGSARALEVHFLPGATTPTWGGAARRLFPATSTLYVSYWVKYSANWVGSGKTYHPHEFMILSDQDGDFDSPSNNWLTAYIEDSYQNGGIPRLALQDNKAINTSLGALPLNLIPLTENRSVGGCNGVIESGLFSECFNMPPWFNDKQVTAPGVAFQPSAGPGYKGDWNRVEVYLQMNSVAGGIGVPDGVMQYWFNGVLVIDRHDILFRTGARPNIQFHQFVIAPYIGDGSPVDQTMWVDDLTLATARSGGTPIDSSVASVAVTPTSTSLLVGATQQLTATLKAASGDTLKGRTVTWASSNPAAATVTASGVVTGAGAGSATITATSEGKSGTAAISVTATVTNPGTVTNLAVTSTTTNSVTLSFTEVAGGAGQPASYDIRSAVGSMSWASATAVSQGTCKVPVAGMATGAVRSCTVLGLTPATSYQFQLVAFRGTLNMNAVFGALSNVASGTTAGTVPGPAPVASVAVSPASVSLLVAATQPLTATLKDGNGNVLTGRTVTWTSSSPATATVSVSGLVTAAAAGSATITATSEGKSGTAVITVALAPVASITVSPASTSLVVGATQQLTTALKDAGGNMLSGRAVTWTSSTPAVATVGSSGLVSGVGAGTTTITATSEGKAGTAVVTVSATATKPGTVTGLNVAAVTTNSVTLSFTEVNDGTGLPASYDIRMATGTLSWASATTVTQGTCKVPMAGTTVGAVRTCTVLGLTPSVRYQFQLVAFRGTLNVNAVFGALSNVASGTTGAGALAPVASVSVSPAATSVTAGQTAQLSATLRDASGSTLTGRVVTWGSSNTGVATVNGSGMVTAVAVGLATITATSEGQSGTSAVTVVVATPPPAPGTWPNEPAGFRLISDYSMSEVLPHQNGAALSDGWGINNNFSSVGAAGHADRISDATAPFSSPYVAQFNYLTGYSSGGYEPAVMYKNVGNVSEIYIGFWWKVSNPWQGHLAGVNKIVFQFLGGGGGGGQVYLAMWNNRVLRLTTELSTGPNANFDPNVNTTLVTLGVWHRVEMRLRKSPSLAQWWLDGVLQGSYTNISWPSNSMDEFQIAPTWGGVGGSNKTENDYYWFDQVHLSRP